jgi:hypothetical protein
VPRACPVPEAHVAERGADGIPEDGTQHQSGGARRVQSFAARVRHSRRRRALDDARRGEPGELGRAQPGRDREGG